MKNLRLIEIKAVYLQSNMNTMQYVMIFVSSCVEAAAKKVGCSTGEMYRRMKRVGLISGFIIPGYEALHTQSREHVTRSSCMITVYHGSNIVVDKYLHFIDSNQVKAYAE